MSEREALQTAEELAKWFKKMGFVPGSKFVSAEEFPSVEDFQKLCKGKSIKLWQDIMKYVRPKEEVLHIQKNLLLQQLRSGKPLEKNPVPGHLSQQFLLASKLAEKEKEKMDLLNSLEKLEISIKSKEKALRKSGHKLLELENQITEFKRKELLFKIKTEECRSKLEYLKEIVYVANHLCPSPPNSKPTSATFSDTAEIVLYKCVDAIQDFHHSKSKHNEEDLENSDSNESNSSNLEHLWELITSNINGWGAQLLWDAVNSKLMPDLMEEIAALREDNSTTSRPSQGHTSHISNSISILPVKLNTSFLEFVNLSTKARIKEDELRKLQEDLMASLKESRGAPEIMKAWIEAQSKKAGLAAKLQTIQSELARLRETVPCRTTATSELKLAKEELVKLDLQVDHDKTQIEQNLAHMQKVACRLEAARLNAQAQRSNFNSQVPEFFKKTRCKSFDSDVDSSSPQPRVPLSSTMIGNVTADSNLSFNTTCLSVVEKHRQSNLVDFATPLKESISKEAKLFIKVHLEKIPFVYRNGRKESMCNLLVQAPLLTSRCTNMTQRTFLQSVAGTPFASAPQIILNHLQAQSHVRALQIYKALHDRPTPAALPTSKNLQILRKQIPIQEKALHEEIEVAHASVDTLKNLLGKSRTNLKIWVDRPIQYAVPKDTVVNGRTYEEWCKLYDEN